MSPDPISIGLILGAITAAIWFLPNPQRADSLRKRLPQWLQGRGTADPFYPFRSWNWTTLPAHWLSALLTSLIATLAFGSIALWFTAADKPTPLILFTTVLAAFHLIHVARIIRKILQSRNLQGF